MLNYYFAGALTPKGFISYFEDIPDGKEDKLIIIKGTAGSGKSSLMKKIAEKFKDDCSVKCYKCFSCPKSLDGIKIEEKKIILLDGTSPHVVEASRANDTIFNIFEFIDNTKLIPYSDKLDEINERHKKTKNRFDKYLKSTSIYLSNITDYIKECLNEKELEKEAENLYKKYFEYSGRGKIKKMFLSSPSPQISDNLIEYNPQFFENYTALLSKFDVASKIVITKLAEILENKGVKADIFFDYLEPEKVKYIYCNGRFISCDDNENASERISFDKYLDKNKFKEYSELYKSDTAMFKKALSVTKKLLGEANDIHDELEKYYFTAVNFNLLDKAVDKLIESISKN